MINESSRYDEMSVGSISNKDNADPKQLKWEMKRNDVEYKKNKRFKKFDKFSKEKPLANKKKAMRRKVTFIESVLLRIKQSKKKNCSVRFKTLK